MLRFHTGWIGAALCGVWQKMQISCSVLARIAPGPDADRLWGLLTMLWFWARASDGTINPRTPRIRTRIFRIGGGQIMASPPADNPAPARVDYTNRRSR